jgi:hypothetical protein
MSKCAKQSNVRDRKIAFLDMLHMLIQSGTDDVESRNDVN